MPCSATQSGQLGAANSSIAAQQPREGFCHASRRVAGSTGSAFLGLPLDGRGQIAMDCVGCGSAAVSERPDLTAQGYRRFRCRDCGKQFNERSDGVLNRASLPSDIIAFVVFCRLRYRLTLRDLSEIMLLRGFTVSHECIRQWEAKLLPVMGEALRKRRHGVRTQLWPKLVCRRDLPQGPGSMVLLVSGDRSRREPHRHDAERDPRHEGGPEVLPLGTVGCRLCAGPGDNRRA